MTADPHIATIQAALRRERLHIEMSDLDKGHEAREFARIDAALAWFDAPATADGVPEDVLHWLDVVTTAILDRHEQYSPAIGIAASALVDWMLEQRRAAS